MKATYRCALCKGLGKGQDPRWCPRCKNTGLVEVQPYNWGKLSPEQIARVVRRRVIGEAVMRQKGIALMDPPHPHILKAVLEHIK